MIGASQKSQSCSSAHPPPAIAVKIAGPVERAGFTEVFVTGMLMRWIRVSPKPIAIGAKGDYDQRPFVAGAQSTFKKFLLRSAHVVR